MFFATQARAGSGSGNISNIVNGGSSFLTSSPTVVLPLTSITTSVRGSIIAFPGVAGDYFTFYSLGTFGQNAPGQPYKVSSGKTCYCFSMQVTADTATRFLLGYGITAVTASSSGPVGEIDYAPTATTYNIGVAITAGGGFTPTAYDFFVNFPQGIYPFVKESGTVSNFLIRLDCVEQL